MAGPTLFLSCAEASGDLHAGHLIEAAAEFLPGARWIGCGGDRCAAAGMERVHRVEELSVLGASDVIRALPRIRRIFRDLVEAARRHRPAAAVLVDSPDLHLRLARPLRRLGIPVVQYVSPQVWAWRPGRIWTVARRVDRLLCILPFEPALYAGTGLRAEYIGHPLADEVRVERDPAATLQAHGLDPGRPTVALLPGSRMGEVERLLPVYLGAARRLAAELPQLQWLVSRAPTIPESAVAEALALPAAAAVEGRLHDALAASDLVWVASGTASVEAALLGRPMVILYRASWLTTWIARRVVRVPYLGLVNILAGREVAPELLQEAATPEGLAAVSRPLLTDPEAAAACAAEIRRAVEPLDRPGASRRAAEVVAEVAGQRAVAAR
ncbi:MAG: lipid-A-disaccharide synthase [Nitrospirae bacterium]|nr:MAG: lipid-A-disaccharide synthase [Nitrospirota bacterium]